MSIHYIRQAEIKTVQSEVQGFSLNLRWSRYPSRKCFHYFLIVFFRNYTEFLSLVELPRFLLGLEPLFSVLLSSGVTFALFCISLWSIRLYYHCVASLLPDFCASVRSLRSGNSVRSKSYFLKN